MIAALLRLLAIVSLAMMPLGMTAPAAASDAGHHAAGADPCPTTSGEETAPAAAMTCTAACTALPAGVHPLSIGASRPGLPEAGPAPLAFEQTVPEIATPPPRLV